MNISIEESILFTSSYYYYAGNNLLSLYYINAQDCISQALFAFDINEDNPGQPYIHATFSFGEGWYSQATQGAMFSLHCSEGKLDLCLHTDNSSYTLQKEALQDDLMVRFARTLARLHDIRASPDKIANSLDPESLLKNIYFCVRENIQTIQKLGRSELAAREVLPSFITLLTISLQTELEYIDPRFKKPVAQQVSIKKLKTKTLPIPDLLDSIDDIEQSLLDEDPYLREYYNGTSDFRSALLMQELESFVGIDLSDTKTLYLAALKNLKKGIMQPCQFVSLNLLDIAFHTVYDQLLVFTTHHYVNENGEEVFAQNPIQCDYTKDQNSSVERYEYRLPSELTKKNNDKATTLLKRFFNLNPVEWCFFSKEMENKSLPESERFFHVLTAPYIGSVSSLIDAIGEELGCLRMLKSKVTTKNGRVEKNLILVPSFTMLQAALNAKADGFFTNKIQLVPTIQNWEYDTLRSLKKRRIIPLKLYIPGRQNSFHYNNFEGDFRTTMAGHLKQTTFAGAFYAFYQGAIELVMQTEIAKARLYLAKLAKKYLHIDGAFLVYERLLNDKLIDTYPPGIDTTFNNERRSPHKEIFGDLFYSSALRKILSPELKSIFIQDMVSKEDLWWHKYKLGKQDLRPPEQALYNALKENTSVHNSMEKETKPDISILSSKNNSIFFQYLDPLDSYAQALILISEERDVSFSFTGVNGEKDPKRKDTLFFLKFSSKDVCFIIKSEEFHGRYWSSLNEQLKLDIEALYDIFIEFRKALEQYKNNFNQEIEPRNFLKELQQVVLTFGHRVKEHKQLSSEQHISYFIGDCFHSLTTALEQLKKDEELLLKELNTVCAYDDNELEAQRFKILNDSIPDSQTILDRFISGSQKERTLSELYAPKTKERAKVLAQKLNQATPYIPNDEDDPKLLFLAALRCLHENKITTPQLASLHLLYSAICTLYTNYLPLVTYKQINKLTKEGLFYHKFDNENGNTMKDLPSRVECYHYAHSFLNHGEKTPFLKETLKASDWLKQFFNFNRKEWACFSQEMKKAPPSEHLFYLLIAPDSKLFSNLLTVIYELITCFRVLDRKNESKLGIVYEKIMLVPSFSMLQAALRAKALSLGRKPVTLVPTYNYLEFQPYATLKRQGKVPMVIYFPENHFLFFKSGMPYDFRNYVDGYPQEAPFPGALHDVYHSLRKMAMTPQVDDATYYLEYLVQSFEKQFPEFDLQSLREMLIDGEFIYSYPIKRDTYCVNDSRPNYPKRFGSIFEQAHIKKAMVPELFRFIIEDMVVHADFWEEFFNIGPKDLEKKARRLYDEIKSTHVLAQEAIQQKPLESEEVQEQQYFNLTPSGPSLTFFQPEAKVMEESVSKESEIEKWYSFCSTC